jgi:hypothetical protein
MPGPSYSISINCLISKDKFDDWPHLIDEQTKAWGK